MRRAEDGLMLQSLLLQYVSNNKEADNDWFRLESNKEGTRLEPAVCLRQCTPCSCRLTIILCSVSNINSY